MNIMSNSFVYTYGNAGAQQEEVWNREQGQKGAYKSVAEKPDEDMSAGNVSNAEISVMDAYESMGGGNRSIPEAEQAVTAEEEADIFRKGAAPEKYRDAYEWPSDRASGIPPEKITHVGVTTLFEIGVNMEYVYETGELLCIKNGSGISNREVLWCKILTPEEFEKCMALYEHHPNYEKGKYDYTFEKYLKDEEFWDLYLEGKIDLDALKKWQEEHGDGELHDKYIQMRDEFSKREKTEEQINMEALRQWWQNFFRYEGLHDDFFVEVEEGRRKSAEEAGN